MAPISLKKRAVASNIAFLMSPFWYCASSRTPLGRRVVSQINRPSPSAG